MSAKEETLVAVDFKPVRDENQVKENLIEEERIENEVAQVEVTAPSAKSDSLDGGDEPPTGAKGVKKNYFVAAKGHVQRVVDVALLISNMSRLATVTKTSDNYTSAQFSLLTISLYLSMFAQILAGLCFFVSHQREINNQRPRKCLDYTAYGCVGAVMVLNIFISTFSATWTPASTPHVMPTKATHQ